MITDVTAENLVLWLKKEGIKMPSIGTIFELNEVAKRYLADGLKDSDLAEAKGVDYIQTELTRVKKILEGKITEEKKAELEEKVKILRPRRRHCHLRTVLISFAQVYVTSTCTFL